MVKDGEVVATALFRTYGLTRLNWLSPNTLITYYPTSVNTMMGAGSNVANSSLGSAIPFFK